jgi:DNA-binding PadR family transcriptional regulator
MSETATPNDHPLTETAFLILLSLAPEPKPGYTLMKDVETLSEGRAPGGQHAFQTALDHLLAQGWAEIAAEQRYALSAEGRRVLDAEIAHLRALVRAVRQATPPADSED